MRLHNPSPACSPTWRGSRWGRQDWEASGSELLVVRVLGVAVHDLLQAIDAGPLGIVPEAAGEKRLAVVAVLLLHVRRLADRLEELVGADLGPPQGPALGVEVEALRDFLPLHALAALLDGGRLVLEAGLRVVHRVLGHVVGLDGVVQVVDGLHTGGILAAARRCEAGLEALLEVLAAGGEGVDLHGMDVDGPRDRGVIGVRGARLDSRLLRSAGASRVLLTQPRAHWGAPA